MTMRRPSARSCAIASRLEALSGSATPSSRRRGRHGDHHDGLTLARSAAARSASEAGRATPELLEQGGVPQGDAAAVHAPLHALPVSDSKTLASARGIPRAGAADDRARQRMLAGPLEAGRQAQQLALVEALGGHDRDQARLALGEGAGLVHHQGVHLVQDLDGLGVLEQHAQGRGLPAATMMDIGVARPSAQGQAMISTAMALTRA
jgi:hypothetical protein